MQRLFQFRFIKAKLMSQEIDTQHTLNSERWVSNFGNSKSGCKLLDQTKQFRTDDKQSFIVIGNPCESNLRHKHKSCHCEID